MSSGKDTIFDILIDHGLDIRGRVLHLHGEITEDQCSKFIKLLKYLDKTTGDIEVMLNSGGGDITSGFAIHDAIKMCNNPVTIIVIGSAMSIATIILQAADKRIATKYSRFMIHRGGMEVEGHFTDVKRAVAENDELDKICANIYLDRVNEINPDFKMSQVQKMMDFDSYFSAEKALELGLIDEIDGEEQE